MTIILTFFDISEIEIWFGKQRSLERPLLMLDANCRHCETSRRFVDSSKQDPGPDDGDTRCMQTAAALQWPPLS